MTVPCPFRRFSIAPLFIVPALLLEGLGCSSPPAPATTTAGSGTSTTSAGTTSGIGGAANTTGAVSTTAQPLPTTTGTVGTGTTGSASLTNTTGSMPGATSASVTTGTTGTVPVIDPSEEIYANGNFPRFDLTLPEASLNTLRQVSNSEDPLKGEYVTGSLEYNGARIDNIGVRLKGEGSFRSIDDKAALKLKFDTFVEDQEFFGLRRLTLNNMVEDPSFLAERLAYAVFRAAGLPAPRCNSATLYVNGEYYGVYANLEAEDKTFLARWFASNDGNLYEEGQVDFVPGNENSFDLETNETENDRTDLINFIAAIDAASVDSFLSDISGSLDTTQWLRLTAAEAAVNQWDMYGYTVFWPNNFRIYNDPTTGKFVFLPWGMDLSMKPYRDSGKPHIGLFEVARQYDRAQGQVSAGLIFRRCLESTSCRQHYAAAVEEIITVYESLDLEVLAQTYYAQIRDAVLSDPKKDYSESEFEAGYQSLLSTIRDRPAAMRADLAL